VRIETGARIGELHNAHAAQGTQALDAQTKALTAYGQTMQQQLAELTRTIQAGLADVRNTLETRVQALQQGNEKRLEQMRATVDEKLQETLEARLGASFRLVSERLEQVHRGLGEMQSLAAGVGDLKRVLTNVKTRGGFGEVQLAALLEQVLTPEQYGTNVATRPGSAERVEFAVKMPGRGDEPCWLPIDAKFPVEDWQRLQDAQERADVAAIEDAARALERRVRDEAKKIRAKYIAPPHTTEFAFLFVPSEGLYAEVLRRPGLVEALQRDFRVVVAGPTTLAAMLNSVQMGFRTLAIEKRSAEVWQVLGAVKGEFTRFAGVLAALKRQLQSASNTVDDAQVRTRQMNRALTTVEAVPVDQPGRLLPGQLDFDMDADATAPTSSANGETTRTPPSAPTTDREPKQAAESALPGAGVQALMARPANEPPD
jgi:DNA recombination protein RmuC